MITLKQLRYLSALARHGHFGRAADACSITQPALSMQIRDLERNLGVDAGRAAARRCDADRCRPRDRAPRRGRADRVARSDGFCTPSRRAADRAVDARHHSVAGAVSAAAHSSAAAKAISRIAAGVARDPDQTAGRGDQERRARCGDAGAAARRIRHRCAGIVRRSVSARGAVRRSAIAGAANLRRRDRSVAADPARGRPLPARSGAGVLRHVARGPRRARAA